MKENFYCKIHTGSMESIEEWNETSKSLELTNLSEKAKQNILFPPVCDEQCFDCVAEVGETRLRTQKIIEKMRKSEFQRKRTEIISEMLDNPDKHGIYPTTQCFEKLDDLFNQSFKDLYEEIKHGDDEHQAWLKDKIYAFISIAVHEPSEARIIDEDALEQYEYDLNNFDAYRPLEDVSNRELFNDAISKLVEMFPPEKDGENEDVAFLQDVFYELAIRSNNAELVKANSELVKNDRWRIWEEVVKQYDENQSETEIHQDWIYNLIFDKNGK